MTTRAHRQAGNHNLHIPGEHIEGNFYPYGATLAQSRSRCGFSVRIVASQGVLVTSVRDHSKGGYGNYYTKSDIAPAPDFTLTGSFPDDAAAAASWLDTNFDAVIAAETARAAGRSTFAVSP